MIIVDLVILSFSLGMVTTGIAVAVFGFKIPKSFLIGLAFVLLIIFRFVFELKLNGG